MALYLISYDITTYDKDEYPNLWAKLKELGAVKVLFSEWVLVEEVGKAAHVYDEIAPCVRPDDRLLVQELTNDAAWDKLLISDADFEALRTYARS